MRLIAIGLLFAVLPPVLCGQDAARIKQNLDSAAAAIRKSQYGEALTCLKAVFHLDAHHQEAHILACDVCQKLDKPDDAMSHALHAYDASKFSDKNAGKRARDIARWIRTASPTLANFIDTRANCAEQLLALRKKAEKAKRSTDMAWLLARVVEVAPTHEEVESLAGKAGPRVHVYVHKPVVTQLLTDSADWLLVNQTQDSGLKGGVLTLCRGEGPEFCDAGYAKTQLRQSFEVAMEVRFKQRSSGRDPHISLMFGTAPEARKVSSLYSVSINPLTEGEMQLRYSEPLGANKWKVLAGAAIPNGEIVEDEWAKVKVEYDHEQRTFSVSIGDKALLVKTLDAAVPLGLWFRLGAGTMVRIEVRNLTATLEPARNGG